MRRSTLLPVLVLLAACSEVTTESPSELPLVPLEATQALTLFPEGNVVDHANQLLAAQGSDYRIAYAEYLSSEGGAETASENIIVARDLGNKRLDLDFIPDDPRRGGIDGDPNTIDVLIDQTQGATASGLTESVTTAGIVAAMDTWAGQSCSALGMNVLPVALDLGLVQAILGFGGGIAVPDVMHAGWLPGAFFDLLAPGGSSFIIGVTFTLVFNDGDLDGDGQPDVAAREIYYNDALPFSSTGSGGFDVQTIALHEAGHSLSQAHFGTIFLNPNSGRVVFSPRAVMNAVYSGVNRRLTATDTGGHCGIWGNWPQR
jgi:hypothetical protein